MKKAVFFNEGTARIDYVYYDGAKEALKKRLDFIDDVVNISNMENYREKLAEVEYIFSTWGMQHLTSEQVKTYFPSAKAIFYAAGSVQHFAREFLENGIAVFSAWGANGVTVAEFTLAQIILANKGYFQRVHNSKNDTWVNRGRGGAYEGSFDTKVGIIGAGMIGKMVIELVQRHRMIPIVYDKFMSAEEIANLGGIKAELTEVFEQCGVISNHLANLPATVGMLDKNCFDRMRPNATFINTGRGAQVVEADLIAALKAEPARTALLDVTYPEPPEKDSELYKLDNVFLSPHIAGTLGKEPRLMADYMIEEFDKFDAGEPTRYSVTLKMLETMA